MIVERILTSQLDSKDTDLIYSHDPTEKIKDLLTRMYVGKCFKKCFVLEITEIIKMSPLICDRHRVGGAVRFSVQCKYRALMYDEFAVITNAKIIEIMENGKILLKSDNAAIQLMPHVKLQNLRIGDTMPVRVVRARYPPLRDIISVSGIPFTPITSRDPFNVNITADDLKDLEPLIKKFDEESNRLDQMESKHRKKWSQILESQIAGPEGFTLKDIRNLTGPGFISHVDMSNLGSTKVWWKSDPGTNISIKNSINVLKSIVGRMTRNINLIMEFDVLYDPFDKSVEWIKIYGG